MTHVKLSDQQVAFLMRGLYPARVSRDPKGFSHLEAWDIRRYLIRVFGFGGFDTDQQDMTMIREIEIPAEHPNGKSRWTVIYRATVLLTVKVDGVELGHWHGTASGAGQNLPNLADAHDLAMKVADSQALKRAAINLGDAFGLSLYNEGSIEPVVLRSVVYDKVGDTAAEVPDAPVGAEQGMTPSGEEVPSDGAGGTAGRRGGAASVPVDQWTTPPPAGNQTRQGVTVAAYDPQDPEGPGEPGSHDDPGEEYPHEPGGPDDTADDMSESDLMAASVSGHPEVEAGAAAIIDARARQDAAQRDKTRRSTPSAPAPAAAAPVQDAGEVITAPQMRKVFAMLKELGLSENRDRRLTAVSLLVGRKVTTMNALTSGEGSVLIEALNEFVGDGVKDGPAALRGRLNDLLAAAKARTTAA